MLGNNSYSVGNDDNQLITKFNELKLFTGLTTLSGLAHLPNLLEIDLPDAGNLKTIGQGALAWSYLPMELLVLPEGVTTLQNHAISRSSCHLRSISLPSTLSRIISYFLYQMPNIETVQIYAITPPTVDNNTLSGIPTRVQFYVPDAALETYKSNSSWGAYASRIHKMSEYPD